MALGRTHIVAPLGATDTERKLVNRTNVALRSLDRRKPIATPSVFRDDASRPAAEANPGRIIFVQQADGTVRGQYSDGSSWQTFLATAVSFATPTITYGTTFGAGVGSTTIRSGAQLKFPTAVMSSANSSTLTLTDDATDQTLTGSLGNLIIASADDTASLPARIALGSNISPAPDSACFFTTRTSIVGDFMRAGLEGGLTVDDGGTHVSQLFYGGLLRVATSTGTTFTTCSARVLELQPTATNFTTGTHSFTERVSLKLNGPPQALQSGSGAVTVTDCYYIKSTAWAAIGNPGTVTNAGAALLFMPTMGSTIRRGYHLSTGTQNLGTEAANAEGYYCEDLTRGTARRTSFYAEGATNSTPTDVYAFYQGTAHVVGTNRYGFRATGATTGTPTLCVGFYADAHSVGTAQWAFYAAGDESYFSGTQMDDNVKHIVGTGRDATVYYDGTDMIVDPNEVGTGRVLIGATGNDNMLLSTIEIDGDLNHDGTNVGFYGVAPTARSAAYTPTNVAADRAYDANSTSIDEIADVLGTLIADLQLTGIIG